MINPIITYYPSPTPIDERWLDAIDQRRKAGELSAQDALALEHMAYPLCAVHRKPVLIFWPGPMCVECVNTTHPEVPDA